MKTMKKIFVLMSMLFVGLLGQGKNPQDATTKVDAAEVGSYAYLHGTLEPTGGNIFSETWWGCMWKLLSNNGYKMSSSRDAPQYFKTVLITNDASKVPTSGYLDGCPVDVGLTDQDHAPTNYTNGCAVAAYAYKNKVDTTKLDLIFYADVETIYPNTGKQLFSYFKNVEKITFDCDISMARAQDASMRFMFDECNNLKEIEGLDRIDTTNVIDMFGLVQNCTSLQTLDLSNFDMSSLGQIVMLNGSVDNGWDNVIFMAQNLTEIKAPKNLGGHSIQLPSNFGMDEIDPSMEGMTIRRGSKEYNMFFNTLMNLKTCDDYMQGPELQVTYNGLSEAEKEDFNTLTDADGVLLTEKLAYMCYLAELQTAPAPTETYMAISPRAGQYLVIVIACLSLLLIGGYYFIQKRKYAK